MDKKELKRLKEMIEEARYRAIDEYRKEVAELECRLEYENRELARMERGAIKDE